MRFYEINPEVIALAQGEGNFFTYLEQCPATPEVVLGDARLSMEREVASGTEAPLDVLILDAFNSDSVPVHLMTREAFEIYWKRLAEDGIIVVHISNHQLDLEPVVRKLAQHFNVPAVKLQSKEDQDRGFYYSTWMVLTRNQQFLAIPEISDGRVDAQPLPATAQLWTDDFTNLVNILK